VVGKGYRFIGPVRVISAQYSRSVVGEESSRTSTSDHVQVRTQQPSLAVMPLLLLGNAADDHGLCLAFGLHKISLNSLQQETGLSRHTILRARRGKRVHPRSL